jgi:single-stranded DNA-binding protein
MNLLVFSGVVVREPKLFDRTQTPFLSFTLKSSKVWKDKTYDSYLDCKVFGQKVEQVKREVGIGDHVQVTGEARAEIYDSEGEKKPKLTCACNAVDVVAKATNSKPERSVPPPPGSPAAYGGDNNQDDPPF